MSRHHTQAVLPPPYADGRHRCVPALRIVPGDPAGVMLDPMPESAELRKRSVWRPRRQWGFPARCCAAIWHLPQKLRRCHWSVQPTMLTRWLLRFHLDRSPDRHRGSALAARGSTSSPWHGDHRAIHPDHGFEPDPGLRGVPGLLPV
jgi:hypothetical protein